MNIKDKIADAAETFGYQRGQFTGLFNRYLGTLPSHIYFRAYGYTYKGEGTKNIDPELGHQHLMRVAILNDQGTYDIFENKSSAIVSFPGYSVEDKGIKPVEVGKDLDEAISALKSWEAKCEDKHFQNIGMDKKAEYESNRRPVKSTHYSKIRTPGK